MKLLLGLFVLMFSMNTMAQSVTGKWITIDDKTFTYNLKRIGTERIFKVVMDLTKAIVKPEAPWGWKE